MKLFKTTLLSILVIGLASTNVSAMTSQNTERELAECHTSLHKWNVLGTTISLSGAISSFYLLLKAGEGSLLHCSPVGPLNELAYQAAKSSCDEHFNVLAFSTILLVAFGIATENLASKAIEHYRKAQKHYRQHTDQSKQTVTE